MFQIQNSIVIFEVKNNHLSLLRCKQFFAGMCNEAGKTKKYFVRGVYREKNSDRLLNLAEGIKIPTHETS